MIPYRPLAPEEITILASNRCTADDWAFIQVENGFVAERLQDVTLIGHVQIGRNDGTILLDGLQRPAGIRQATVADCVIGRNVLINRIGSSLQNIHIADHVIIEDVYLLMAEKNAAFGMGVQVEVLNEAGGRTVTLHDELNSQTAYMQALFRHDQDLQKQLQGLVTRQIQERQTDHAYIETGVVIRACRTIINTHIGAYARLNGVSHLENGTILSCQQDPTLVGADVVAHNFIMAEGAQVEEGVILDKVYVGQATRLSKQFSAENTVLFCNCEGLHSEVCSVFAGPYTVTHHRSTLLIASLFSFFNAGSGTNQSNHMYKLGPVHQGIMERGTKTGSFSYALLECHLAPFTILIGKHMSSLDLPDLPFSYITEDQGNSVLRPALNLFHIGTVRDAAKWRARDRRRAEQKRDMIHFHTFSPYTVEKMRRGRDLLLRLYRETSKEKDIVNYGGVQVNRLLLAKGAKFYGLGIDRYLIDILLTRLQPMLEAEKTWPEVIATLQPSSEADARIDWMDVSGLLVRKDRLNELLQATRSGAINSMAELNRKFQQLWEKYDLDEWDYAAATIQVEYGIMLHTMSVTDLETLITRWEEASQSGNALVLENARKEFASFSQIGFGLGWGETERRQDFAAVRGVMEEHPVIRQLQAEKQATSERATRLRTLLERFRP
jgi:hypothetical protein